MVSHTVFGVKVSHTVSSVTVSHTVSNVTLSHTLSINMMASHFVSNVTVSHTLSSVTVSHTVSHCHQKVENQGNVVCQPVHPLCLCVSCLVAKPLPYGPGSLLEKCVFDPILTHFWS